MQQETKSNSATEYPQLHNKGMMGKHQDDKHGGHTYHQTLLPKGAPPLSMPLCCSGPAPVHWGSRYNQAELGISAFTVVSPAPVLSLFPDHPSFTLDTITVLPTQRIRMGSGQEGLLSPEGCSGRGGGEGSSHEPTATMQASAISSMT